MSRAFAVLLAVLLACAQQAAALHALSHVGGSGTEQDDKHLPAGKACAKCLAFTAMDGVAKSEPATIHLAELQYDLHFRSTPSTARLAWAHYRSRAPPSLP